MCSRVHKMHRWEVRTAIQLTNSLPTSCKTIIIIFHTCREAGSHSPSGFHRVASHCGYGMNITILYTSQNNVIYTEVQAYNIQNNIGKVIVRSVVHVLRCCNTKFQEPSCPTRTSMFRCCSNTTRIVSVTSTEFRSSPIQRVDFVGVGAWL
jgi:hypothetical protein